ncbi:hypothetical protein ACEN8K_35100, partial [Variovorax sp. CT11-76]
DMQVFTEDWNRWLDRGEPFAPLRLSARRLPVLRSRTVVKELSMIHHELGQWPLVISVSSGLQTLEDMQVFTEDWNRWLDRGEPFASLRVFADADALVHPEGSAQSAKQWLQARGADIRRHMMGMASVVPPDQYEKIRKMNVEKLFGVPAASSVIASIAAPIRP